MPSVLQPLATSRCESVKASFRVSYIKELLPIARATDLLPQYLVLGFRYFAFNKANVQLIGRADRLPGVAPRRSDKGHLRGGPSFQPCPGGKQTWRVSVY